MAAAFKIGVQLPEVERDVRWDEVRAMALLAEDAGFDSLWVGDHLLYRTPDGTPRGPWEAWSQLAALAAVTTRVELGPLVAATSFHAPAMIAKKAATIDEISGGRLILGLGAGWHETEYRAFGFPFDHRVSRFEEAFTIIRTLLREGEIDFSGRFYSARDAALRPCGPRPGGPPIMVGSIGERMLAITAPHVDLWNAWYDWFDNAPSRLAEVAGAVDAAEEAVGRPRGSIGRTAAVFVRTAQGRGRVRMTPDPPPSAPIEGSTDEIAGALAAFAGVGVSHLQLVIDPIDERAIASLAPAVELAKALAAGASS
jgi:alkanesulfonate monooxygenase SsuD/methylene tetrahydromethanopterin reductase-like flavin-dependent oxidoreductase (luciferase family)